MDLKAYEKRRVRELHRRITRNLNSRRRYAERKGRSFAPYSESIRKRFYCYYLLDTLDRFYFRDLAFLRDPDCLNKEEGFCDISFPESSERGELLGSHFPRNYCLSNCQRVILMRQMKRVMIGGNSFGRTLTI